MDAAKLMELMKSKKQSLKQKAKTLKPNAGANRYVLLPGWREEEREVFFHEFGQHFIKDETGTIKAIYVCTDRTFGKPCQVCDTLAKAIRATTDQDTANLLKEASAGASFLLNVLALDTQDANTPQILQVGKGVILAIIDLLESWGAAVFDSENPQVITINREGVGLKTKYTVQVSPKKHSLPRDVLSRLNNLDEYVAQENEEQMRRAIAAVNASAGLLAAPAPATASRIGVDRAAEVRREMEPAPVVADVALDDELDDLLGDLNGTDNF